MNTKRFFTAGIAIFFANQLTDPIIHSFILGKTYETLSPVWRPDMMEKMWIMVLASVAFAFLFTFIFIRGYKGTGAMEGFRFGVLIGLLMSGIAVLQQYVIYPVPFYLAIIWFVCGMMQYVLYGMLAALIYKPKARL